MPLAKKKPTNKSNTRSSSMGGDRTQSGGGKAKFRAPRCFFCMDKSTPHYLYTPLNRYITEKGKIIAQTRTGLCHKHQRQATLEIKKARYMALMPFTTAAR